MLGITLLLEGYPKRRPPVVRQTGERSTQLSPVRDLTLSDLEAEDDLHQPSAGTDARAANSVITQP